MVGLPGARRRGGVRGAGGSLATLARLEGSDRSCQDVIVVARRPRGDKGVGAPGPGISPPPSHHSLLGLPPERTGVSINLLLIVF